MNDSANLPPEPKKSIFKNEFVEYIFATIILAVSVTASMMVVLPIIGSYIYKNKNDNVRAKVTSLNNLRHIGLAVSNYSSGYESNLPFGATTDHRGNPLHGWMTEVIPYLDQVWLAQQINYEKSWNDPGNQNVFRTNIPEFINPAIEQTTDSAGYALAHYTANSRLIGSKKSYRLDEVSNADGIANTIMLGEINSNFPAWGSTANFRDPARGLGGGPDQFGSPYKSVNVVFSDGSGRSLSKNIDPQILKALSTPDGGEPITEKDF